MKVNLKNYTTTVPASKSINEIQNLLVKFGASGVALEADGGLVTGLMFAIKYDEQMVTFKLPANINRAQTVLFEAYKKGTTYRRKKDYKDFDEIAVNVAWRILRDWVHAQLTIIQLEMVEPLQVFLPYVWNGERTLYDRVVQDGKLLTDGVRT